MTVAVRQVVTVAVTETVTTAMIVILAETAIVVETLAIVAIVVLPETAVVAAIGVVLAIERVAETVVMAETVMVAVAEIAALIVIAKAALGNANVVEEVKLVEQELRTENGEDAVEETEAGVRDPETVSHVSAKIETKALAELELWVTSVTNGAAIDDEHASDYNFNLAGQHHTRLCRNLLRYLCHLHECISNCCLNLFVQPELCLQFIQILRRHLQRNYCIALDSIHRNKRHARHAVNFALCCHSLVVRLRQLLLA